MIHVRYRNGEPKIIPAGDGYEFLEVGMGWGTTYPSPIPLSCLNLFLHVFVS